jgi:hypothetical protein
MTSSSPQLAITSLNKIFINSHAKFSAEDFEQVFYQVADLQISLSDFIQALLETTLWSEMADEKNIFKDLCLDLSLEIEAYNAQMAYEPEYHSRKHFIDVSFTMSLLISQNQLISHSNSSWTLTPLDCWYLLLAAIGHDYGHNGAVNFFASQQELNSIAKIHQFFKKKNIPENDAIYPLIKNLLLSTDPKFRPEIIEKALQQPDDLTLEGRLSILLLESDLMGSSLPERGIELGNLLSLEFEKSNPKLAGIVASIPGRLHFLKSVEFISDQAKSLGADLMLKQSILRVENEIQ